jgi:hypothetical protein
MRTRLPSANVKAFSKEQLVRRQATCDFPSVFVEAMFAGAGTVQPLPGERAVKRAPASRGDRIPRRSGRGLRRVFDEASRSYRSEPRGAISGSVEPDGENFGGAIIARSNDTLAPQRSMVPRDVRAGVQEFSPPGFTGLIGCFGTSAPCSAGTGRTSLGDTLLSSTFSGTDV